MSDESTVVPADPGVDDADNVETAPQPDPAAPLSIAQIENFAANIPVSPLDIEGLGRVYVRGLNTDEAGRIQAMAQNKQIAKVAPFVVCRCLCDQAGNRQLSDSDVTKVAAWSRAVSMAISDRVMEISGIDLTMSEDEIAEAQGN